MDLGLYAQTLHFKPQEEGGGRFFLVSDVMHPQLTEDCKQ
jgi:hypothetical protein